VEGIRTLIELEPGLTFIGHAADAAAALEAAELQPNVILLEAVLEDRSTLDFLPDLLRVAPAAHVLILTGETDPEIQVQAMRQGASGVILKSESGSNLFAAIRMVHNGEAWVSRALAGSLMNRIWGIEQAKARDADSVRVASLTPREYEVAVLTAEGLRNKQIAERLFISETTVRHYLTSIFDKLDIQDRLELIIYAYQHGLVRIAPAV
jgi:DNA-binding NarL/FixJ family response regulator